jgi:hypothetical protein
MENLGGAMCEASSRWKGFIAHSFIAQQVIICQRAHQPNAETDGLGVQVLVWHFGRHEAA